MDPSTFVDYHVDRTGANDFNLDPATMHGAAPGTPLWLVEENDGSSNLLLTQMSNLFSPTPTFNDQIISVPTYGAIVPPTQPNGKTITTIIDSGILDVAAEGRRW